MTNPNMARHLFVCDCGSLEHQMILSCWEDDDFDEMVYLEVHLAKKSWRQRLVEAVKYIFGHQSRFGAFDEIVLGEENCQKLGTILLDRAQYYQKRRQERNVR
jgi:hypothetical protein